MLYTKFATILIFSCALRLCGQTGLTILSDDTDIKNLTKADLQSLLQASSSNLVVPLSKEDEKLFKKDSLQGCIGTVEPKKGGPRASMCFEDSGAARISPAVSLAFMLRACILPSPHGNDYCMDIMMSLAKTNIDAAQAIVEYAPNCSTTGPDGMTFNRCVSFAIAEGVYADNVAGAKQLASVECNQHQIGMDCEMLQGLGVTLDANTINAANAREQAAVDAAAQQRAAQDAADAQRQQEANAKLANLQQMAASVSANGGLIQQTANQQEANILAAGNRPTAPQPYTPPQPTPSTQPSYQPPVTAPPPSAPSAGCVSLSAQVAVSSAWKTGLGSMPNEVVVTATNNAGVPVTCSFHYHKAGAWDAAHGEQIDLAPGQTLAGEAAGLWYMGADNSEVNYACYQKNSTTPQGSACSALPF